MPWLRAARAYGSETLDQIARSREAVFATDCGDRIVLWNKKCEALLGKTARSVLGKRCYEVLGGRDVYGNIYCIRGCPVVFQARERPQEPIHRFSLSVEVGDKGRQEFEYSLFAIPSHHPALSTLVHVLRETASETQLERQLARQAEVREPLWPITANGGQSVTLSEREMETLRCLARGMTTEDIGKQLLISGPTVRNHIQHILEKLGVHSKLGALVFAYQHDLLTGPRPPADDATIVPASSNAVSRPKRARSSGGTSADAAMPEELVGFPGR
jgi:DNA-binding CsgD family transcriptional regulator